MATYAAMKEEFRKFREELDKNMETYQNGINEARAELERAKAAYKEREKELKAAYEKRDAELNDLLHFIKNETDRQMFSTILDELNREEEMGM